MGVKARTNSAQFILDKISEINSENRPVFLSGDFNLEPDSEGIQLIKKTLKDSKEIAETVSYGSEGTFNGFNFDEAVTRRIDYIFVNDQVQIEKYAVLSDSKLKHYPSDHFPVLVIAELK